MGTFFNEVGDALMSYLDLLLNVVGLLILINWRSLSFVRLPGALSLASAVKPAEKKRQGPWPLLSILPALLVLRGVFYWQFGPSLNWTPQLNFGVLIISFHCESFWRMMLFSLLSFGLALAVFQFWLLLLAFLNRNPHEQDPHHRLVLLHLGWLGRLPGLAQFVSPMLVTTLAWPLFYWMFTRLGLMPPAHGAWHVLQQAMVVGIAACLAWKYFVAGLLLLYFLNSYIYFGPAPFWNFIALTGHNLLTPLRWLRLGRVDLAPVAGMVIVIGLGEWLGREMPKLYQRLPF
ncbi:MAG: hypothetical protein WCO56_21515 [Verrucomicrobiota bacterium]